MGTIIISAIGGFIIGVMVTGRMMKGFRDHLTNKYSANIDLHFDKKTEIAIDYLTILQSKEDDTEERARLEYLIEKTNDPVFKAKLTIEKLARFGKE